VTQDLTVYTFHPQRRLLLIPLLIIAVTAVFGFVRGLMGAADLTLDRGFSTRSTAEIVGKDPRPVILQTIPSLTPKLIGLAPEAPKVPTAVNAPISAEAAAAAAAAKASAALAKTEVPAKVEPAPPEAPPAAAPAPPPPPANVLQGLY
jgi:hypothetical protein